MCLDSMQKHKEIKTCFKVISRQFIHQEYKGILIDLLTEGNTLVIVVLCECKIENLFTQTQKRTTKIIIANKSVNTQTAAA